MSEYVSLAELQISFGFATPEQAGLEAGAFGLSATTDGLGRPALTFADAKKFADALNRRAEAGAQHDRDWAAVLRDTKAWARDRDTAIRKAAADVRSNANGKSAGSLSMDASAAAQKAAEDYERTVPRPELNGVYACNLEYINDQSLVDRVAGKVRQAVTR